MAAQAAARKKAKPKGKGSFGYPWGTERPNDVLRRLEEAQFAQAEDEIRQIEAETARRIRKIKLRMVILDQVKRGVQQCCVVTPGGKFRFSRDLADAAGPMIDLGVVREVVDLDKRRPGRPSATANPDMQALRSVMRELVHEPAAHYRRRLTNGLTVTAPVIGIECKSTPREIAVGSDGEAASSPTALAPASDIVVPAESEPSAETAVIVGEVATWETLRAEAEPEPVAERDFDPAVQRILADALSTIDMEGDERDWVESIDQQVEADPLLVSRMRVSGGYGFRAQTQEREQSRMARLDLSLLPEDLRAPLFPEMTGDPNSPVPALQAEFWEHGLPWFAKDEDLSETDIRKMMDVARAYQIGTFKPRDDYAWEVGIRQAGGLHRMMGRYTEMLKEPRRIEALRHEVWPLVAARRDILNGLAADVASGKLTFSPLSDRPEDLERSLEYTMFREADYTLLNSLNRTYWDMWALRMVDKLDWPAGLSRRELSEKFGAGQPLDTPPNLCVYDPSYPDWLVPYHYRAIENGGILVHAGGEPFDMSQVQVEMIRYPTMEAFWDGVCEILSNQPIRGIDVV